MTLIPVAYIIVGLIFAMSADYSYTLKFDGKGDDFGRILLYFGVTFLWFPIVFLYTLSATIKLLARALTAPFRAVVNWLLTL